MLLKIMYNSRQKGHGETINPSRPLGSTAAPPLLSVERRANQKILTTSARRQFSPYAF